LFLTVCAVVSAATTYTNPVISEIGPADPAVIKYEGKYYMYPTGDNVSYYVYVSSDLVNWAKGPRVFMPAGETNVWAPDVYRHPDDGKFYMYYTANHKIGVAVANAPDAQFTDLGILLDSNVIDAHVVNDNGSLYMYYTDIGHIYVHQMASPTAMSGPRQVILEPSQSWEMRYGSVNEGPWMIKHNGLYYLLYSGSGADSMYYGVGYATADNPLGPFTKYPGNPIIQMGGGVYGPGHGAVTTDSSGNFWHLYHQKTDDQVNWSRFITLDPMWFTDDGVLHSVSTRDIPQPAPATSAGSGGVRAYWRFEGETDRVFVEHTASDGAYAADIPDYSGNDNDLSVWQTGGNSGYIYRDDVAFDTVPNTRDENLFSVKNSGTAPSMWCSAADLKTIEPAQWTVEVTCKMENNGYKTIIGRDSYGTCEADPSLGALYLQVVGNNALAIKYCDVSGYWHDAISDEGVFVGFDYATDPDGLLGKWYSIAAVSDGLYLSLYIKEAGAGTGYELIARSNLIYSGSPDTALTAGAGDGIDWDAGDWTVGRGIYNGNHADRAYGFIDEVRISDVALSPVEFLGNLVPKESVTAAWWRFEEGKAGELVGHDSAAGVFDAAAYDYSGNGNHLSSWSLVSGAMSYSDYIPSIGVAGEDNTLSLTNENEYPGLFTDSGASANIAFDIETWQPATFTIEASFNASSISAHHTVVGRDAQNVASSNGMLSALYFQVQPDHSFAVKYTDVSSYFHEAVSAAGAINPGNWYHAAAVCDGETLKLYLNNESVYGGYVLVAETDVAASGSPDRRMVADNTIGGDWHGGGFTVGRGLYDGRHVDRFFGNIDEVRLSSTALETSDFLFSSGSTPALVINPDTVTVSEQLETSAQINISPATVPDGVVTVSLFDRDARGQITISTGALTFTSENWNIPQPVTVSAVEDDVLESTFHQAVLSIQVSSATDSGYASIPTQEYIVLIEDNECGAWGYAASDFNVDCVVNLQDFTFLALQWLECTFTDNANCGTGF
jgi:GH43 family beta-xylosidase